MILTLLLAAAAAAGPDRLVVIDQVFRVEANQVRPLHIPLRQRPSAVECRFMVTGGRSGVRLALMRNENGRARHVVGTSGFDRAGGFRFTPLAAGNYTLVLDNTFEGRAPADVRVTVTLLYGPGEPEVRVLSPQRRAVVILLGAAFFAGVASFAAWRLRGALRERPGPPPPSML